MYDPYLWPAGSFVRRYFEPRQPRDAGVGTVGVGTVGLEGNSRSQLLAIQPVDGDGESQSAVCQLTSNC